MKKEIKEHLEKTEWGRDALSLLELLRKKPSEGASIDDLVKKYEEKGPNYLTCIIHNLTVLDLIYQKGGRVYLILGM